MTVTLPVPPSANIYWRTTRDGRTYVSKEARDYKELAARLAAVKGMRPIRGVDVEVHIDWFRERRVGDLDNRLKVIFDALKGVAYTDDKQIAAIDARRFDDPKNPRIVVQVQAMGSTLFEGGKR